MLAILHILEPIFKIGFHSFVNNISPFVLFQFELDHSTILTFIEEIALFPVAGILILLIRRWSYFLFLFIEAWIIFINARSVIALYENGQYVMFYSAVLITLINLLIILYFIFSTVKNSYHDPRLRWWESTPRYSVICKCKMSRVKYENFFETESINISESGILLKNISDFDAGQKVEMEMTLLSDSFFLRGDIVHKTTLPGNAVYGLGIKFVDLTSVQKTALRFKMRELEKKKYPRRPKRSMFEELFGGILPSQFFP